MLNSKSEISDLETSVICFIQARFLSSRLIGKVLKKINKFIALELCVRRLQRCNEIDEIIVLTGDIPENLQIVTECTRIGVACFQGPEEDVLGRFSLANEFLYFVFC